MFYINVKTKLVETFMTLQKIFNKPLEIIERYKLLKLNKRDIYGQITDTFFTYTLNTVHIQLSYSPNITY